jgi:hypothetical protein
MMNINGLYDLSPDTNAHELAHVVGMQLLAKEMRSVDPGVFRAKVSASAKRAFFADMTKKQVELDTPAT